MGWLAPAAKTERLAAARSLLAMPPANPMAAEQLQASMQCVADIDIERCLHCGSGRWRVLQTLPSRWLEAHLCLAGNAPSPYRANVAAPATVQSSARGPPS